MEWLVWLVTELEQANFKELSNFSNAHFIKWFVYKKQ